MKRNFDAMLGLGLRYSILLVLVLFISACAAKLIDIDKSVPMLNLSEEQSKVVQPKMMAIKEIAGEYELEKEQLEEEISSRLGEGRGGRGGASGGERGSNFREKFEAFRKRREAYLSAIKIHVADIKAVLNEEQLIAFEKMELPKLEMLEMPSGRRPGRGGEGRGGRGGKGGGGRRGGGMF